METALAGLCTGHPDPDLWFSDTDDNAGKGRPSTKKNNTMLIRTLKAIEICDGCPVIQECQELGMLPENRNHGVWGGLTSGERIILHSKRTRESIPNNAVIANAIQFSKRVRWIQRNQK